MVLLFKAVTDSTLNTNFFIDTASLTNLCPVLNYSSGCTASVGSNISTTYLGQTFTPTTNTISAIRLGLSESGTLGTVKVYLTTATDPTTQLDSWTFDVATSATIEYWTLWLSTPLTVVPTGSYRIVLMPNGSASAGNSTNWWFDPLTPPPYSGGDAQISGNSGLTWQNLALSGASGTFSFETFQ